MKHVSRRKFLHSSATVVAGVASYSSLPGIAHAIQGEYDREYVYQTNREINFEPFTWPSQPPADCPFENSTEITGLRFNGRCNEFLTPGKPAADTWYFSWASDDRLYSGFTDGAVTRLGGGVDHSVSWRLPFTTGQAVAEGDDPINLKIYSVGLTPSPPEPYGGRYPCGSLVLDGVCHRKAPPILVGDCLTGHGSDLSSGSELRLTTAEAGLKHLTRPRNLYLVKTVCTVIPSRLAHRISSILARTWNTPRTDMPTWSVMAPK